MKIISSIIALAASSLASHAAVTLQFSQPFSTTGGVASNFANAAGVATNGMVWGVIIDTTNSGFSSSYDLFTPTSGSIMTLSSGGMATTNVLVTSTLTTSNNVSSSEFSAGFALENPGGDGGISAVTNVPFAGIEGINTGDAFRLVWFDPSGSTAGFVSDASFLIQADGSTFDYSAIFRGSDPIRSATGISIVPEPSALLLSVFGFLALLRRRR